MKTIYLAGGCFWGTEHYFKQIDGVISTTVGYANGRGDHAPSYQEVCTGVDRYAETVKIDYDESRINLRFLLDMYFVSIDPTLENRQGHDIGVQYRTGIYYVDDADKNIIEDVIIQEQKHYDLPIKTEVGRLDNFYPAEEYHQDYLDKNPSGYCHLPVELFEFAKKAKM